MGWGWGWGGGGGSGGVGWGGRMDNSEPSLFFFQTKEIEDTGMLSKDSATWLLFKPEASSQTLND